MFKSVAIFLGVVLSFGAIAHGVNQEQSFLPTLVAVRGGESLALIADTDSAASLCPGLAEVARIGGESLV